VTGVQTCALPICVVSPEEHNSREADRKKHRAYSTLIIELKYGSSRERILTDLKRVSRPGRRVYARKDRLPRVLGGMGTAIMSTSKGLVTNKTAEQEGIGGEVICFVW
jgi:small subunit ribosomal protein S8